MTEKVEFTNMCMICDDDRVVVIDRKKRIGRALLFLEAMWKKENHLQMQ